VSTKEFKGQLKSFFENLKSSSKMTYLCPFKKEALEFKNHEELDKYYFELKKNNFKLIDEDYLLLEAYDSAFWYK
jgi:hypothetical protein